jgi:hypothetical protein
VHGVIPPFGAVLAPGSGTYLALKVKEELEFVVTECMKTMLSERAYRKYSDAAEREKYLDQLGP